MKKNTIILIVFIVLAVVAGWLYFKHSSTTIKPELRDFAIADTASVDKIFLADKSGNTTLLERKAQGRWMVNGKFYARSSGINTLLYTMKNLEVRSPVGKNLYNNTMKLMASSSVKIEIYQHNQLVKTYYVGHPTMDTQGTFMYLEGSSVPFIMHIPGFIGYLSTRYFAAEAEWKEHAIFRFSAREISDVKVENFSSPHRSFELKLNSDSTYTLTQLQSHKNISPLDPAKLRKYLLYYQNTNYEREDKYLSRSQHDSLLHAGPYARIEVHEKAGKSSVVNLYRLPITQFSKEQLDAVTGKPHIYDVDKFTMQITGDTTWYIGQYFHFDNVLRDPLNFSPGPDKTAPQKRD